MNGMTKKFANKIITIYESNCQLKKIRRKYYMKIFIFHQLLIHVSKLNGL